MVVDILMFAFLLSISVVPWTLVNTVFTGGVLWLIATSWIVLRKVLYFNVDQP